MSLLQIVVKGTSNNLMKRSAKRRRSRAQIREEKRLKEENEQAIQLRLSQMDQLEQNMLAMQQKMQRTDVENNQVQQVKDLLDQGLLKINQNQIIEPVADPEESEMLRLSQFDDAESKLAVEDLA